MTIENENISLKRFIRCEKCGKHMTGYMAYKNQKYYYKCRTRGCGVNKRADDLHPQFTALLDNYTVPLTEGLAHFIKKYTSEAFRKLNEQKEVDGEKMQKQLDEMDKKLNRLEERFIEEEITKEMYLKYTRKKDAIRTARVNSVFLYKPGKAFRKKEKRERQIKFALPRFGGGYRDRTGHLKHAMLALYQMS